MATQSFGFSTNECCQQAMHPSKLTFQSLRVHINQEFEEIKRGIAAAFEVLKEGGRCGLLTWKHSECAIVMDCYRNYEISQVFFAVDIIRNVF